MDLRKIKKLIDLLEESNLSELEIKEGEEVVRLNGRHAGLLEFLSQLALDLCELLPKVLACAFKLALFGLETTGNGSRVSLDLLELKAGLLNYGK